MKIPPATSQVQGPAIYVQGLEKSYKELRVLRGVDFEVAPGSIFALLGSNGAGKTTVVKILSTLLRAGAGTARVNGFDVTARAADIMAGLFEQAYAAGELNLGELAHDELAIDLLDALAVESDPRMERMLDLLRERGWAGWTRLERLTEPPG